MRGGGGLQLLPSPSAYPRPGRLVGGSNVQEPRVRAAEGVAAPPASVTLLGPLVLVVGGEAVVGLPRKERALVALLALRPGRPVGVDEIAGVIWEGAPPPSGARKAVQVLVYRLRKRLDDAGSPDASALVVTQGESYVLALDPDAVDAGRFERLVSQARRHLAEQDPGGALDHLDRALALWRGDPLPDLGGTDVGLAEQTRLVELLRAVEEDRYDARLALGEHDALVGELEAALAQDRLRERRWRQLMLALYRSGRQADALRAYQRVRSVLVEELGIEPGPDLRRLEAAIISHDPDLDLPRAARPEAATDRAGASGSVARRWARRQRAVEMVDRRGERDRLRAAWQRVRSEGAAGVVLVAGEAGAGKSRLAAELVAETAPADAVLAVRFVRSTGTAALRELVQQAVAEAPSGEPGPTLRSDDADGLASALAEHIVALGGERGVLLVLDDLHEADTAVLEALRGQLERVGGARLLVVITHRDREQAPAPLLELFADLHRMGTLESISLGGLGIDDACSLLAEALHVPVAEESRVALAALAVDCGGRPLYLLELARHAVERGAVDDDGRWSGGTGVERLGVPASLRAFVDRRLAQLSDPEAGFLAACAMVGPELDPTVAALAADVDEATVLDHFDQALRTGFLVEVPGEPGRCAFATAVERTVLRDRLSAGRAASVAERLVARHGDGGRSVGRDRGGLEERAGDRLRTGDVSGAWELFGEAADEARGAGDVRALAHAAVGAARVLVHLGVRHPPVIDLLRDANDQLAPDDPLRTEVRMALQRELLWAGRWHEAAEFSGES